MRTATRMMMMGNRGKSDNGQNSRGDWNHSDKYEREFERGERGRMDREDWQKGDRRGRNEEGRHREKDRRGMYDEYDDDEEGGGKYAGNFRHRENSRKHEAGEAVRFDEHKAKEWVSGMKNGDGSTGEHWRPEQTEPLRTAHCPDCEKMEFWAAMNMMYSDYCEVAKKMNVDKPEFYACMAKAFLMDEDAGEEKLAKYMRYVAGK